MNIADRAHVRRQYASEERLETRRSVWRPAAGGRDPAAVALAAVVDAAPTRVLEVGCGPGRFAGEVAAALPDAEVVATDQSERFVELTAELTAERGVTAQVADVQHLPFDDGAFDVVCANWMLYHVPDLHRGLAELRRVLRPGGTLVAVTNGDGHVADLRREAGLALAVTHFSSENGEAALRRHFDDVTREDLHTRAVFPDADTARAYLASSDEGVAWSLPDFAGPREYAGHVTVFTAR